MRAHLLFAITATAIAQTGFDSRSNSSPVERSVRQPGELSAVAIGDSLPDSDAVASAGGVCGIECEACWFNSPFEFDCDPNWEDDGTCDCGCQFPDSFDCGLPQCDPPCDFCHYGTQQENNCPEGWAGDGTCDCGCQFSDSLDCGYVQCEQGCDFCHLGSPYENACPDSWEVDGDCDCGCQFSDAVDCAAAECDPVCDFCWFGSGAEGVCPLAWIADAECDCGCQFSDAGDCGIGGSGPDLIVLEDFAFPTDHNAGYALGVSMSVVNQGNAATDGATLSAWYISTDAEFSIGEDYRVVPNSILAGFPAGGIEVKEALLQWPDLPPYNTPGQRFYFSARTDYLGLVNETNEENNWALQQFFLTLCDPAGDLTADLDSDLDDYRRLPACFAGPGTPRPNGCFCADRDEDGDVDLRDVAAFIEAYEEF